MSFNKLQNTYQLRIRIQGRKIWGNFGGLRIVNPSLYLNIIQWRVTIRDIEKFSAAFGHNSLQLNLSEIAGTIRHTNKLKQKLKFVMVFLHKQMISAASLKLGFNMQYIYIHMKQGHRSSAQNSLKSLKIQNPHRYLPFSILSP